MALNSRQKRARKRHLALQALAKSRNQPMVATEGRVRSVWSKTLPPVANIRQQAWEGSGKAIRAPSTRFKVDGAKVDKLGYAKIIDTVDDLGKPLVVAIGSNLDAPHVTIAIPNSRLTTERQRAIARLRKREE